jgi:hypothetical protein
VAAAWGWNGRRGREKKEISKVNSSFVLATRDSSLAHQNAHLSLIDIVEDKIVKSATLQPLSVFLLAIYSYAKSVTARPEPTHYKTRSATPEERSNVKSHRSLYLAA